MALISGNLAEICQAYPGLFSLVKYFGLPCISTSRSSPTIRGFLMLRHLTSFLNFLQLREIILQLQYYALITRRLMPLLFFFRDVVDVVLMKFLKFSSSLTGNMLWSLMLSAAVFVPVLSSIMSSSQDSQLMNLLA